MTQFRGNRDKPSKIAVVNNAVLSLLFECLFASRAFVLLCGLVVVLTLSCCLQAQAASPDDRGGAPGGGPGGPDGPGGGAGRPGGGPVGPGGFGVSRDPGGRGDVDRLPGGRAPALLGRGTQGSRWNEEGFFDDDDAQNLDHQRALAGVKSGRYRSLKQVISILGIPASSRIIRMDLRSLHGADVYSIIVRNAAGLVERMTVSAETGERID